MNIAVHSAAQREAELTRVLQPRRDHAIGARDPFARDFKGRAVIGARAWKWQSERHVHTVVECVKFQRDQTLVVIHAKNRVEFTFGRAMKNRVGRMRAGEDC